MLLERPASERVVTVSTVTMNDIGMIAKAYRFEAGFEA